jgi:hypothetical protein
LYIGDGSDNSVKRFDATTGTFIDIFITQNSSGTGPGMPIHGPRGLLSVQKGNSQRTLLLANQNVGLSQNGTILRRSCFFNAVPKARLGITYGMPTHGGRSRAVRAVVRVTAFHGS